jgi:hypothetical protein
VSTLAAGMTARLRQTLLHPYALYFLLTLLVFLFSGFDIGPVNDGWIKLASYLSDSPLYGINTTRVFGSIPRDLGMELGGGGFVGWQLFLLLFTLLRGVLFYEIARRLFPQSRALAVACGCIALFQPADAVDFWVDVTGVQMGLVTALAACLCALVHLQTGRRAPLLAMLFFQLFTCLTYSGFLLLMLAFPAGVWLLRWAEGKGADWRYLLRCCWLPVAYVVFQLLLVALHFGHEGDVADMRPWRIVSGYGLETLVFLHNSVDWLGDLRWTYLPWALPVGALAWFVARESGTEESSAHSRRYWWVLCLGLLALAAVCYFPYAVSSVRLGGRRQLFIAAVFLYMLPLLPLYLWLPRRLKLPWLPWAFTACVALISALVGLEHRDYWAEAYRGEERLLASFATAAPNPKPDTTFVVHLHDEAQSDSLGGFYNRRVAFEYALRLMYGDHDIDAAFTPLEDPLFFFEAEGLRVPQSIRVNGGLGNIPYDELVVLDYSADGKLQVLDRAWLQRLAPAGTDLKTYAPEARLGTAPSADSKVCVMLERKMRPDYCR